MNQIAVLTGELTISWNSVVITLGLLCGLVLALALYRGRNQSGAAVWLCFVLSFVIGVFVSRLLHWYFNASVYTGFKQAMTDWNVGSFCLPGMIIAFWPAAWLVTRTGLARSRGQLLDAFAPGLALAIGFIRLSALFDVSCRSRIVFKSRFLQTLPFASPTTDMAGNVTWRFATFFVEFILLMLLTILLLDLYFRRGGKRMKEPCASSGNIWRLFLVFYGAIEIIMDSTRYDSPLLHFRVISYLNQYSAFISLAQIFAAACALGVLIYYVSRSVKANGFKLYHLLLWVLFIGSLVVIGYLGEYKVQRTAEYLRCYSLMAVGCLGMALAPYWAYRSCLSRRY